MKTSFSHILLLFFAIFSYHILSSQQLKLNVYAKDSLKNDIIKGVEYKFYHQDKSLLKLEISKIKETLKRLGYLNIADSLVVNDQTYTAYFDLGKPINQINIDYHFDLNLNVLKNYTYIYNDSIFTLDFKLISPFLNDLVDDFEKKGETFTQLKLSNITFKGQNAYAHLTISNNEPRTINNIIIKNYEDFPKPFLSHYLKLRVGDIFNTSKLNAASKKINYLSFVSEIKPPEVLFTNNKTNIYLYLKKSQSNSIDGLIGFTSKEGGTGILFNGYLDLQLENAFNSGESISLLFKNDGLSQQKFNIGAKLPYIFNSKFSASGSLNIFKQDSLYINTSTNLELKYPIQYNSEIGVSINSETSSNLLSTKISNLDSYKSTFLGLSYQFLSFADDDLFQEKINFKTIVLFGNKTVETLKTNQFKILVEASYLWLFNKRHALFIKNESALLHTSNYLTNQLFRVGGYKNLRGFDEESIFASSFSILNFEYRYKTNFESYLYTITDFAYLNNAISHQKSNLYSLGLGYKFRAKIGVINMSYAIAINNNQTFKIGNSIFNLHFRSYF